MSKKNPFEKVGSSGGRDERHRQELMRRNVEGKKFTSDEDIIEPRRRHEHHQRQSEAVDHGTDGQKFTSDEDILKRAA